MFDREFFARTLPEHVRDTVSAHAGKAPVLELHLGDRTVLDLCYIVRLADTWLAVAHFCRDGDYDNTDIAFIPYLTITRITLTMVDEVDRPIGFRSDIVPSTTILESQSVSTGHSETGNSGDEKV